MKCGTPYPNEDVAEITGIPECRKSGCTGLIRPDVVWFGEMLPEDQWDNSVRAIQSADILFSIGTSGVVYPAASLPLLAKRCGVFLVEINAEPTPLSDIVDEFLMGRSGEILPQIYEEARRVRHV
jgi:NAD-dependent deacetylase